MKKKYIILIMISILVVVVVFLQLFTSFNIFSWFGSRDVEDNYDRNIKVMNETYKTKVIVYGDDIDFRATLNVNKVTEISNQSLSKSNDYEFVLFIFNNKSNNRSFSQEELELIAEHIKNNKLRFIYVGENNIPMIEKYFNIQQNNNDVWISTGAFWYRNKYEAFGGLQQKNAEEYSDLKIGETIVRQYVESLTIYI